MKVQPLVWAVFLISILACSHQKECNTSATETKPLNPNGDSELALLMRAMYDEAAQIKEDLAKGQNVSISLDHEKILTADATEPEKAASEEYKAFAYSYLQTVRDIREAEKGQQSHSFDNLVANCVSCHKAMCPGPLVKINKLL